MNEMYLKYFKIFGIEKYVMRFSTHDPAKLGQEIRQRTRAVEQDRGHGARRPATQSGINYVEVPNEAAFYGPKIDVQVWSVIGREFTIATNQVDFAVPSTLRPRLSRHGQHRSKTPLCIHRAPLGTHERFIGFLIEHYAGNFPLWLAPEQVRVLTIGDEAPLLELRQAPFKPNCAPTRSAPRSTPAATRSTPRSPAPSRRKSTPCWSSAVATWKPTPSASASTAKATSAPSRATK